jgi:2-methylcitrate dehydratase PrpD
VLDVKKRDLRIASAWKLLSFQRVNAQFNVRYCVASALLRKGLRPKDFDEPAIRDPEIMEITDRIYVTPDPDLEKQGHNAAIVLVKTKQGIRYETIVGLPRGGPESPLTREEHVERFYNCFGYAGKPLPQENAERILSMVTQLEGLPDIRTLIPLLVSQQ